MSRTTFFERFDKANKFFDIGYHHHKATYKGLAQFFENYSDIEKSYANSLLKHAQKISSIPDFGKEQQYIKQGISEIGGNLQRVSQLHFNFGERLHQISEYCQQQYLQSKRQKQKCMKMLFEKASLDHERVRSAGNREKLNDKQKQICKSIYDGLDGFLEDQVSRSQKLKEQCIIFFSLSKKIAEKKVELSSAYNIKLAQFQVHVKMPLLQEIEDMLVQQYNGYGQDQIFKKNREVNKQITVNRQSLRESIVHRQKILKIQDYISKLNKTLEKYKKIPEQLNYPNEEDYLVGIFDRRVVPQFKKFSREFKSQSVKQIAFAWLWSFNNVANNDQSLSLLTVVKANLKVRHIQLSRTKSNAQFVNKFLQISNEPNKKTLFFLIYLSQIYEGTLRIAELQQILKKKDLVNSAISFEHLFHWKIYLVLVDYLLDSVIIVNDGYSILYDEYVEIFKLINQFAKQVFNLDTGIIMTILLRKIQRVMQVTQSQDPQKLQEMFEQKMDYRQEFCITEELKMQMCHKLINFVSQKLCIFYKCKISFSNLIKLSLMFEKILPKNYFTAIENMHSCIKIAGFRYFQEADEDNKLLEGVWKGDQRLKNLTEVLEGLELQNVYEQFLFPMARELSRLLGVGYEVVVNKMKKQFSQPIFEIIQCNLQMLGEQEGHDKQGYILRLGICLSIIDLQQPQELDYYTLFFTILQNYLSSTEKDYDQLLEHARRTELWIVQQNSQATQNCIDFCSLLYKPFQFLLISLKKLEAEQKQTQFTKKFSDFIKLKLNRALKSQIEKYVKFLFQSLDKYCFKQPELTLKYKRLSAPILAGKDVLAKQGYNLREVTRRLFNLMFLKDQLDEIVCDFIDPQIYSQINSSIFNLQLLSKVANTNLNYQQILTNIYEIALLISQTNDKLVNKVADIAVYHFMGRLFSNVYFQEEKGFFSSDKDYTLSEYTFVKCQQELQELFLNITRNLPMEVIDNFSKQFCISFCKAYRYEVLDTNKFKIPIKQQKITGYLQSDLNFFCNLLKQKFMSAALVKQFVEDPCLKILRDIEKSNQKLMDSFSQATLKNDNDAAKYILSILNLKRDERAEQFVQKYKKIIK